MEVAAIEPLMETKALEKLRKKLKMETGVTEENEKDDCKPQAMTMQQFKKK